MIQVRVKATNLSTNEIVYEGVKKTYTSYNEAWNDIHKAVHYRYNTISSYKLPCELKWQFGERCYISSKHGNIRLTHYIVYDTENR